MKVQFIGATHEVTGSCTLLEVNGRYYLVDCGMEQGEDIFQNVPLPVPANAIEAVFLTHEQGRRVLSFSLPMAAFVLVANFLGLYVGLLLYLFGAMVFQGGYRPLKAGVISVASVLIFYAVFEIWFQVPLLKGPIEAWLKLH